MKEQLLKTASELSQPPDSATQEFSKKHEQLAEMGNQIMAGRSDVDKLVGGEVNQQMAEDNNRNFARFMASLFTDFNPKVLVETALWVFRAYRSHGFKTTYWAANLNIWVDMIRKELSKQSYEALYPYYNWLIVNIPIFVKLSDEALSEFAQESMPQH
ncbi:MAG: hypothetical protein PVI54_14890 [Desulfobacteraceae bacterium]|jgi:hypothetical protein